MGQSEKNQRKGERNRKGVRAEESTTEASKKTERFRNVQVSGNDGVDEGVKGRKKKTQEQARA